MFKFRNILFSLTIMLLLQLTSSAFANNKSYPLPITREGRTVTRVAHNFWTGEYPGPVINVESGRRGYYTASGYKSLRKLNQPLKCSIKKGIYHPWSKTGNSVINYYTISAKDEIKATRDTKLDKHRVRRGQVIKHIIGVGEGYCVGQLGGREIDFFCDDADTNAFRRITKRSDYYEQWLYVKCRQGYNAFIRDKSLLSQPGVTEGRVVSYGKVGA